MPDGLPDLSGRLLVRRLLQDDAEPEIGIAFMFAGPAEDELFGVMVEVALVEGRRIHGVEELADVAEAQFDQAGGSRVGHKGRGPPKASRKKRARFSRISFDSPAPWLAPGTTWNSIWSFLPAASSASRKS